MCTDRGNTACFKDGKGKKKTHRQSKVVSMGKLYNWKEKTDLQITHA